MKDSPQIFIDQRGQQLRALVTDGSRVLATTTSPGPLDSPRGLQDLVAKLVAKAGRKPESAHLVIADDQVEFSTYRLQEMPQADVKKIVLRSISAATGEKEPIFRLTPLAPQQDKDVFLAEQIPRETVLRLRQHFAESGLQLASISTGLQANLAAFTVHRDEILQAHAIFDISPEAVTATFLSSTEVLHHETQSIQETDRDSSSDDEAGRGRALKRRLFSILNVIHGIYSQYMLANPLSPVEKVWLCGPESAIEGLTESLFDAMDVEVATFDLLAGQGYESLAFTPLAGLVTAQGKAGYVNFIPDEILKPVRVGNRTLALAAGGIVALALLAIAVASQLEIGRLERQIKNESAEVLALQVAAEAERGQAESLRFLKKLNDSAPPLYAILGEIANRLPAEIQLDGLNYRQENDIEEMELLAVTRHATPWQNERIFTALMTSLDGSQHIACKQEPDIAMLRSGEEKLIKIKVTCQMTSPERRP